MIRRVDFRTHVALMLNRQLTKEEVKEVDRRRREGYTLVSVAEHIARSVGEKVHMYPKDHKKVST